MRTILLLGLCLAAMLTAPDSTLGRDAPPGMVGGWAGDWKGRNEHGWARLVIEPDGACEGILLDMRWGLVGTIRGTVNQAGQMRLWVTNGQPLDVSANASLRGPFLKGAYSYPEDATGRIHRGTFTMRPWPSSWPDVARYRGVWMGDWSGGGLKGTVRIVVNREGEVEGSVFNTTQGVISTLEGLFDPSGMFAAEVHTPGQEDTTLVARVIHGNTMLRGSFVVDAADRPLRGSFSMRRMDPAQFEGAWVGPWQSRGLKGTNSLLVNASGAVTGTIANPALQQSGTLQGQIGEGGVLTGHVTYPNSAPVPVQGLIRWAGRNILLVYDHVVGGRPLRTSALLRRAPGSMAPP